ncbi:BtrH N-terminal domain-containing protein [Pseudonocardia broussonetiae]|uniref:BtrH N-terminal domain-containing protein n=1 Tax=Pseudonocardia broussonetiae TaxID=2736640 RepID=A0A6M6JHD1_9PSEU|nr:BtrH N-terminal domain-containing protein [Pseudonocardia broussonetiae]QJY47438.1 BtrH N-terminal domain-containing protein [Pseudonocardia broussonetiae]
MTRQKQLKARIRARMARTGESYSTARLHVAGPSGPVEHAGYRLRGGTHPASAALANVLAHHGVRAAGAELSEALVFGIAGGPGAGYILWEFAHDGSRPVVLGFSSQWQYADRAPLAALSRLGVPAAVERTGGAVGAARALDAALDAGTPALVWPDRHVVGYGHLPASFDGMGGHPVVVHGRDGDRYRVDDRTLAPLGVPADRLRAARARVGSYKNLLVVPRPEGDVPEQVLHAAVADAITDGATRLGGTSASFALPAWAKWARTLTDAGAAKGWPRVFADGRGLTGALASVWEGASPAGATGGHLRDLTAAFLDDAGPLVGGTAPAARAWRAAAAAWHGVAEAALPVDVPPFARLRELTAAVQQAVVAEGDAGAAAAEESAGELWALRAELDATPPLSTPERDDLFAALAARLRAAHAAEVVAVAEMAAWSASRAR